MRAQDAGQSLAADDEKPVARRVADDEMAALREAAKGPGGLCSNDKRRHAWPILLQSQRERSALANSGKDEHPVKRRRTDERHQHSASLLDEAAALPAHGDEGQVKLDVGRSFVGLLDDQPKDVKMRRREQLQQIINAVLRLHPRLRYFQGFHDIVGAFLLVLDDPEATLLCVEQLALFRIRDSMGPTLEPVMAYLRLLRRVLRAEDPKFAAIIEQAANLPYFSLSWILTLLAHDLPDLDSIARLLDFLLAHNPAMTAYLAAALVLEKRAAVEEVQQDPETVDDPAMLHATLSKLPKLTTSAANATTEAEEVSEKDEVDYPFDPDVSTPAFRDIQPFIEEVAGLSVDELVSKTLALWSRHALASKSIAVHELLGKKSCVFTWDVDLSEEEAEDIIANGTEIVIPEQPAPIASQPFKSPLLLLLRKHAFTAAVGVAGLGIVLAVVLGDKRSAGIVELVRSTTYKFLGF